MFGDVLAASISAGCLTATGCAWWQGLWKQQYDELFSLYLLAGFVMLPLAALFGMLPCGEAWVFVGVTWLVSVLIFSARSFLRLEENARP